MKYWFFVLLCLAASANITAQHMEDQCYPSHWWVGLQIHQIQVMVHGDKIADDVPMMKFGSSGWKLAPGVFLTKIERVANPNYVFLDLAIHPEARPCQFGFPFVKNRHLQYELKAPRKGNGTAFARGVSSQDLIYLIMPDRFSNGDPANDKFSDLRDTSADPFNPRLRHGGDFQGIINHLPYCSDLGVTALWLTPVVENDMPLVDIGRTTMSGYHGYWFTNQYQIDKRFGGNDGYKMLIDSAHAHGLKIIQDAVYNHVGDKHFLFIDQPAPDWFNQWPQPTGTSGKVQPLVDPYASKKDRDLAEKGWFTHYLPDVNQANPMVATFLIQYAIWAVEEFGIDGWRVDTYYYSDKDFLNKINEALYKEFPKITVFGEVTTQSVTEQAYFTQNNIVSSWKSNLQGCIDFQLEEGILAALNEEFSWKGGVTRLYNVLAQDILYKDPTRNEIILDNHDQDRFYSVIGEDFSKYKQGITILMTQRGIPQLYYGTEILMKNFMKPGDAQVREDFPGGWQQDSVNKFLATGRSPLENEAFDFVKKLAHFRSGSPALTRGKLMQYAPSRGLYVYFRYDSIQTVMVALNTSGEPLRVDPSNYRERTDGFSTMKNIISDEVFKKAGVTLAPKECGVWELIR